MLPFRTNYETSFSNAGSVQTPSVGVALNGSVPFTITAWVKAQSGNDNGEILSTGASGFNFYVLLQTVVVSIPGFPRLQSDGRTNPVTPGVWHYLACVFDGSTLQLFIDGVLDSQATISGVPQPDTGGNIVMGLRLQGSLNSVRVIAQALSAPAVLEAMFQPDPDQVYAANFDFTLNPPRDTSGHNLPLNLVGAVATLAVSPGAGLLTNAYCQPIHDNDVNPGGGGNDAYSIQAWVWVERPTASLSADGLVPAGQAIFVNQSLNETSGVALYLEFDTTTQTYRVASLRGDITVAANRLLSQSAVPFGEWVNLATTYDPGSNQLSIYINAVLDAQSGSFPAIPAIAESDLLIGGAMISDQPSAAWTLQGFIQSVDVWTRALTQAQVEQWQNDYPVLEDGLAAHYDFSNALTSNENTGNPVGMTTRAVVADQLASGLAASQAVGASERKEVPVSSHYKQLPPEDMAKLRASISFADVPDLEGLLARAKQRELSNDLSLLVPAAMVPNLKARLDAEWTRVSTLIRERPLELGFLITYHIIDGEHVLIHHTPVRSTVVFRASREVIDDCTMWRIRLIFTILMGMLSVFGVTAALTAKATQFIQTRILGNAALMRAIGNIPPSLTAAGLFTIIGSLYSFGVLWALIKIVLTSMGWWALAKLLVKILVKFFGAAIAIAETIVSLVIAVAQVIIVIAKQPANCPLIPSGQTQ